MAFITQCLTLLLSFLLIVPAEATVGVMRFPSGTPVYVCLPSDPNPSCGGSGGGVNWEAIAGYLPGTVLTAIGGGNVNWQDPIQIGYAVLNGGDNDNLYVDSSGNLANSNNWQYFATNSNVNLGQTTFNADYTFGLGYIDPSDESSGGSQIYLGGNASFGGGYVYSQNSSYTAQINIYGTGSEALGDVVAENQNSYIQTGNNGVNIHGVAQDGYLYSDGRGDEVNGVAQGNSYAQADIQATSDGASAFGVAQVSSYSSSSYLNASGEASNVMAWAQDAYITANSTGSHVSGYAQGNSSGQPYINANSNASWINAYVQLNSYETYVQANNNADMLNVFVEDSEVNSGSQGSLHWGDFENQSQGNFSSNGSSGGGYADNYAYLQENGQGSFMSVYAYGNPTSYQAQAYNNASGSALFGTVNASSQTAEIQNTGTSDLTMAYDQDSTVTNESSGGMLMADASSYSNVQLSGSGNFALINAYNGSADISGSGEVVWATLDNGSALNVSGNSAAGGGYVNNSNTYLSESGQGAFMSVYESGNNSNSLTVNNNGSGSTMLGDMFASSYGGTIENSSDANLSNVYANDSNFNNDSNGGIASVYLQNQSNVTLGGGNASSIFVNAIYGEVPSTSNGDIVLGNLQGNNGYYAEIEPQNNSMIMNGDIDCYNSTCGMEGSGNASITSAYAQDVMLQNNSTGGGIFGYYYSYYNYSTTIENHTDGEWLFSDAVNNQANMDIENEGDVELSIVSADSGQVINSATAGFMDVAVEQDNSSYLADVALSGYGSAVIGYVWSTGSNTAHMAVNGDGTLGGGYQTDGDNFQCTGNNDLCWGENLDVTNNEIFVFGDGLSVRYSNSFVIGYGGYKTADFSSSSSEIYWPASTNIAFYLGGSFVLNDSSGINAVDVGNRELEGNWESTASLTMTNASSHAGQATCFTTGGKIGYCTTVVGLTGGCTCTGI